MPARNINDCEKHAGQTNVLGRTYLDEEMRRLPYNQAGVGRHKCPYCAFETGKKQGYADAVNAVIERIAELEP